MKRSSSQRPGFSLVELMIAIMILGLGMVMVATVFPVSLDMTRNTLQMNISDAAFDAAVSTLRLKVPSQFENLEPGSRGAAPGPADIVLWPDVRSIELEYTPGVIDETEYFVEYASGPAGDQPIRLAFQDFLTFDNHWNNGYRERFGGRVRAFTEQTYWDAEMHGVFRNNTWVVASMNLPSDDNIPVLEANPLDDQQLDIDSVPVPYIQHPDFSTTDRPFPRPRLPRIHLADRVYPPLNVETLPRVYPPLNVETLPDDTYRVWDESTRQYIAFPDLASLNVYVAQTARGRRYAWTAFARQGGATLEEFTDGKRTFICTIVLTYRGDLDARYARQEQPPDGQFNFSNSNNPDFKNDVELMRVPRADSHGKSTDTVFPQPWLVMLKSINPMTGVITCTSAVARLLPVDSYLIIASHANATAPQAGAPIRITGNPGWDRMLNAPASLQMPRYSGPMAYNVPAWVFPPAIRPDRVTFHNTSPVVGVAVREITPDWGK